MLSDRDVRLIASLWVPEEGSDFADEAYASAGHKLPFSHYVARIRHLGISGDRIIDAGCARKMGLAMATVFDRVFGIDKSAERIATAQWLADRFDLRGLQFDTGDIPWLTFR